MQNMDEITLTEAGWASQSALIVLFSLSALWCCYSQPCGVVTVCLVVLSQSAFWCYHSQACGVITVRLGAADEAKGACPAGLGTPAQGQEGLWDNTRATAPPELVKPKDSAYYILYCLQIWVCFIIYITAIYI